MSDSHDGKISPEENQHLEELRKAFEEAARTGSADLDAKREAFQSFAAELLIDLSGKIEPGPDVEPEGPYIKPGGWGANSDPATWKVTSMKDHPELFKVVDDKGKNVATGFKTVAGANAYIEKASGTGKCPADQHFDAVAGKCVANGIGPALDKDQFGIMKIYRDMPGSEVNTTFKLEQKTRNYASGKPSEESCEYTAIAKSNMANSDIECTVYEKINGFKTKESDSISLKMTGPPHQDGSKSWVIPDFMTDGSAGKTMETENPHPKNKGVNPKPVTKIGGSLIGAWVGLKSITYIKGGKRFAESWIHFPVANIDNVKAEQDKWRQYVPVTEIESSCTEARGKLFTVRLDGIKKGSPPDFKYCSVREITPPS